jgi:histidinol-phosphatase (PHP family)
MVDFHTHTYLCEHATGTPSEYADEAIRKGLLILGFSDHAPLPDHLRDGISMFPHQAEEYISMIENLKNEYRKKLEIRIGFEVDFPLWDSFDAGYFDDSRIDYLIGSCHFLGDWAIDSPDSGNEWNRRGIDQVYSDYYDSLLLCADSGLFDIIGHFDLAKKFGYLPKADFTPQIRRVAQAAARTETAVELNTSGLRKPAQEIYPSESIIKILFEENVPVTLGSDSHLPMDVGADFDKALALLKKYGYRKISVFDKRKKFSLNI